MADGSSKTYICPLDSSFYSTRGLCTSTMSVRGLMATCPVNDPRTGRKRTGNVTRDYGDNKIYIKIFQKMIITLPSSHEAMENVP
jgi:hypothetical protein